MSLPWVARLSSCSWAMGASSSGKILAIVTRRVPSAIHSCSSRRAVSQCSGGVGHQPEAADAKTAMGYGVNAELLNQDFSVDPISAPSSSPHVAGLRRAAATSHS
jgi:hypothetical protein